MNYFIVDAESDGLYGKFLSVAARVYNHTWQKIDEFYGFLQISVDEIEKEWVRQNVYPYLKQRGTAYVTESELLEAFWSFWMKYQCTGDVCCFADVPYPVESRLFLKCVKHNLEEREFMAPFPIYDLETILKSKGETILTDREQLLARYGVYRFRSHYALDDVGMTAELLKIYWDKGNI